MKPEIAIIIARQEAGEKLSIVDISVLMDYALELLRYVHKITSDNLISLEAKYPRLG